MRQFQIRLNSSDAFQLLDGLTIRAEQWEETSQLFRIGSSAEASFDTVESDTGEEAENISRHYREIIADIEAQITSQV